MQRITNTIRNFVYLVRRRADHEKSFGRCILLYDQYNSNMTFRVSGRNAWQASGVYDQLFLVVYMLPAVRGIEGPVRYTFEFKSVSCTVQLARPRRAKTSWTTGYFPCGKKHTKMYRAGARAELWFLLSPIQLANIWQLQQHNNHCLYSAFPILMLNTLKKSR